MASKKRRADKEFPLEEKRKRRRGDRKDAYLIRNLDPVHKIMPFLLPGRCNNEACLNELIMLDNVNAYLRKKNEPTPEFKYTLFHVLCAATIKVIALRPKLNYFIQGHRLYERKALSISFLVKKKFKDEAPEAFAIFDINRHGEPPIRQIHDRIEKIVTDVRNKDITDSTTETLKTFTSLPRPVLRSVIRFLMWLDYHGWVPKSLTKDDPYNSSVFVTNLGSIKMHANYHHLTNWGTNSLFAIVDEKHLHPVYAPDGTFSLHEAVNIGITVDERIADGLYFANSIRLLKKILDHPEVLDQPMDAPVDFQ